jgi:MFS superfamily sulfate permease-like transporter
VLSGMIVILLAVLFSALFLGLFVAIAVGVVVRGWLLGRSSRRSQPKVIEAEYTVVDQDDSQERRGRP